MGRVLALALAAALGLSACGAAEEVEPAGSTASSEPEARLPDIARVVCVPGGPPRIETPAVRPQSDGIHIELVNATGKRLVLSIEDSSGGGMGSDAPRGTSGQVVDLQPGTVAIACYGLDEDDGEVAQSRLEIVDQDAQWISVELSNDCQVGFSGITDYVPEARGEDDPLAAAKGALAPYMREGDVVERAGYRDAAALTYRLVRAGETLATVSLFDDGSGGWLADTVTGCSSLQD
jgi:hypothetical protein